MAMFETAMFIELMEKACRAAHDNSKKKGFWDGPEQDNIPTKIALIHSELSEMLEAYRDGNPKVVKKYITEIGEAKMEIDAISEEAADVFIRLADLCGRLGVDLGRAVLEKMEYNRYREYRHGGKTV